MRVRTCMVQARSRWYMRSKAEATERPTVIVPWLRNSIWFLLPRSRCRRGALVMVERDAFIVVIGEIEGDELRGLVQRQQAFHAARDRGAVGRVEMQHAAGILADFMDRRMDGEAGRVDAVVALGQLVAVEVDLDQARSGDFVEHQPRRG